MKPLGSDFMNTGTPGITVTEEGHRIIDKEHRGVRIYVRLGHITHDEARCRLAAEVQRVDTEFERIVSRPRFADGATST